MKALILFLLVVPAQLFAQSEDSLRSKELWMDFIGTNFCKPKFCAEKIPPKALEKALTFYKDNQNIIDNNRYMAIVDFTLNSTIERFFLLNIKTGQVESMYVSHGKNSETELGVAGKFSNEIGSEMSSLGFYLTDHKPYVGKQGTSLKLDGISETNSNARARYIVLHGADYASKWFIDLKGRLGVSQGCPAVPKEKIEAVIKKLKGRGLLYIHKDLDPIL